MTEEQLHKQTQQREQNASADKSPENKRRRLIKGAVAIPVIMTLSSGAAAARSSNIYGIPPVGDAMLNDQGNKLLCVHGTSDGSQVDIGDEGPIGVSLGNKNHGCDDVTNGFMVSQGAFNSILGKFDVNIYM